MKNSGKTVLSVTVISVFSRLLSLVSIQVYLSYFGASDPKLNIFSYALSIPNIIFTCLGSSLNSVVVPIYSAHIGNGENEKARRFLNTLLTVSGALVIALILLAELLAPLIPYLSEYGANAADYDYAVYCLRVMLVLMLFYWLSYILQGVLQSHGKFKIPAMVSLPSSIIVILYVLILGGKYGVDGLLYASFIGLSLQALILIPSVLRTGYRFKPEFNPKNPELRTAGKLVIPVIAGVSAYQINMFVNISLASRFNTVSLMNYVQNIVLVSVLTIIYSMTSVYYPRLSILWGTGKNGEYKEQLYSIFKTVLFLMIPATVGFILMRFRLFDLIARFGKFGEGDVATAGNMLGFYSIGIVFICLKEVLDKAFYAQKDTKTSAIMGFVIMGVNIVLSFALINTLGTFSMPLAYSAASIVGVTGLMFVLCRRIGAPGAGFFGLILKCLAAAAFMGAVVYASLLFINIDGGLAARTLNFAVPVVIGIASYAAAAYVLKIPVLRDLTGRFFNKRSTSE